MKFTNKMFAYDNLFSASEFKIPIGEIRQVSELSLMPGCEIIEHIQKCDEVTFAVSGRAKVYCDDVCTEMLPGEVHYLRNGMKHNIIADGNSNFRYICIGVIPDIEGSEFGAMICELQKRDSFFLQDNGDIRILTELLLNEFYMKDDYSKAMVNLYITQILILISRGLDKKGKNVARAHEYNPKTDYTIYHVLRHIDREYLNIKNVKDIAHSLSYSENYLSHLFKEKMGITIKSYLLKKKLSHAETLLKTSEFTVEAIAEFLGFNSVHSFYQAFVRVNKMSPSEYRKLAKEQTQK